MTRRMYILLGCLASVGADRPPDPADEPSERADTVVVRHCMTAYRRSSRLGSATHGILQDCLVELGDHVKENQVLGRLYDKDVRAEVELFKTKSESDLAIRLCEAKHAESLGRLKASKALRVRNMVSKEEYTLDELDATTCELELEGAKFDGRLNKLRYVHAEAVARSREIVSPHAGIVVEVLRGRNETVSPTEPAFHIVDVSRLRVTGLVDVSNAWRVKAGQPVRVRAEIGGAELPIEDQLFEGRVVFVDRIINQKNQTCRVVAEIGNVQDQLRAGLEVRMEISLKGEVAVNSKPAPARAVEAPPADEAGVKTAEADAAKR